MRGTYEREKHGAETDDRVEWERRKIITSDDHDSANCNKQELNIFNHKCYKKDSGMAMARALVDGACTGIPPFFLSSS